MSPQTTHVPELITISPLNGINTAIYRLLWMFMSHTLQQNYEFSSLPIIRDAYIFPDIMDSTLTEMYLYPLNYDRAVIHKCTHTFVERGEDNTMLQAITLMDCTLFLYYPHLKSTDGTTMACNLSVLPQNSFHNTVCTFKSLPLLPEVVKRERGGGQTVSVVVLSLQQSLSLSHISDSYWELSYDNWQWSTDCQ